MYLFRTAVLTLVAAIVTASSLQAQTLAPYEVKSDGTSYKITMGPEQRNLKQISVFFVSPGNITTVTSVTVDAPIGVTGSARGGFKGSTESQSVLASSQMIQPLKIRNESRKDLPEFKMTPSTDDPRIGSAYVWFHLQKDACSGGRTAQYVAQVTLDLSGVDPALYDQYFNIYIALKEFKYTGDTVASIKPKSDGKYKNEPILLMGTVNYGNEYVNIVKWSKGRIKSSKRIPVVKYVGYKGHSLSLARLKGNLSGGKATFEISDGADIYAVCFVASARRQSANGYPSPE